MSRRVETFRVPLDTLVEVEISSGPLHVEHTSFARETIEFWAEVDDSDKKPRTFRVYDTGEFLPHNARHVGSVSRDRHDNVYHLYELVNE